MHWCVCVVAHRWLMIPSPLTCRLPALKQSEPYGYSSFNPTHAVVAVNREFPRVAGDQHVAFVAQLRVGAGELEVGTHGERQSHRQKHQRTLSSAGLKPLCATGHR